MVVDSATSAFAGDPQPVEIHHRGIWYSGELLGWRHESDGRVVARVRCVVDRLRHSAWKDLTELRLPDPARPPRKERFPALPLRQEEVVPEPEDDATRPHVLLAGLRSRPPKPDHAVAPPVTPQVPRERPQRLPLAPCSRTPVPEHDHRHWPRVERTAAELSGV